MTGTHDAETLRRFFSPEARLHTMPTKHVKRRLVLGRSRSDASGAGELLAGVGDPVGVALLGEEALPVLGELGVDGVARDQRVEAGDLALPVRTGLARP